jgi:hypothetical protein
MLPYEAHNTQSNAKEDYCARNLTPLFSREREAAWAALRQASNDSRLSAVEAQLYDDHLRAIFIQLMLIAVGKSCSMDASSDAHVFVMMYLKQHNHSEIDEISKGYNQAFASSGLAPNRDGVAEMVAHFAGVLTSDTACGASILGQVERAPNSLAICFWPRAERLTGLARFYSPQ